MKTEARPFDAFDQAALAPDGMIGWTEEMEWGRSLLIGRPGELQIKLVRSPRGLLAVAAGEQAAQARELLLRLGFRPEHIRRMLCG